ncbi:MAG TPA: 16S rRNA (cytidine(1402)-2'-O)-methyltransferase [Clostridiales bacterium]|nr:16S rRNA (cytidine(1402)-2'-O)-methyltransferase [Clostridiales bacterium]HQP70766.1 16S rRNA (cytidine(1402)-2'-O)-methyltransferase [Clostridiales bacterium]
MENGKLYIVSTPIGNYDDITLRALKTLKEVDLIACEDTRKTGILLKYYGIEAKLMSYHDHNENYKGDVIVEKLENGENVAVVSDAGTPCISDPGFKIVRSARERGIEVVGVPGVSAAVNALVISGMPTDSFVFEGFLPHKKGRMTKLSEIKEEKRTVIVYESVHRILKLIGELCSSIPDRRICVLREMTKIYEEHIIGYPCDVLKKISEKEPKGEFVVIIEGLRNNHKSKQRESSE